MRECYVRRVGGGPALHAVFAGVFLLSGTLYAQAPASPGAVGDMPLPGGLRAAVAQLDEPVAADRSQFLLDIIRRTHRSSVVPKDDPREAALRPLLAHLTQAGTGAIVETPVETVPLPLSDSIWIDTVFGGRATRRTLAGSILSSRGPSLLYYGLLALDDETRAWLAGRPELIAELSSRHAAGFMTAAPGLRVNGGALRLPGGPDAEPAWAAVAGANPSEADAFLRALVSRDDGLLAYFFASLAQLTPGQLRRALDLDAPEPARRADAARRLYAVYGRLAPGWKVDERTFWRPALDPALLLADFPVDAEGRSILPATRRFWIVALADTLPDRAAARDERDEVGAPGEPFDFAWLAEQVFQGDQAERRRRYHMTLFASRLLPAGAALPRQAVDAVRAAGAYPALVATLERARLTDVATYASAARRAAALSSIDDAARAARALAQYQGTLLLITRGVLRGSLAPEMLAPLVASLSAIDTSDRGDYEGRILRWIDTELLSRLPAATPLAGAADGHDDPLAAAAGPLERDLLRLAAGAAGEARFVEWEGTRYRVDLAWAEATRMTRLIGDAPHPYLTSARRVAAIADAMAGAALTRESLRAHADAMNAAAQSVAWDRCRDVASEVERAARKGDIAAAARLASSLRALSDDLLARGLTELAYAASMGHADRSAITADAAAARHDFGQIASVVRQVAWRMPVAGGDPIRGWRVTGSLLGLDVRLAEFALVPLSAKPPKRRPSLNDEDRRAFVEGVALVNAYSLSDADRDGIAAALRDGRRRLASVRSAAEAEALADDIHLGPLRRTLLAWIAVHDRGRLAAFLSSDELLGLGLGRKPLAPAVHGWGAPAEARLGCLCLQVLDRRPWEPLAGRWGSGIFASAFPDLSLRLAELLADMQMPAALLGPVLASATLEFVNSASSRDEDDRRGLVEYVHALASERLEQYLALLTTDGPLVPVSEATGRSAHSGVPR